MRVRVSIHRDRRIYNSVRGSYRYLTFISFKSAQLAERLRATSSPRQRIVLHRYNPRTSLYFWLFTFTALSSCIYHYEIISLSCPSDFYISSFRHYGRTFSSRSLPSFSYCNLNPVSTGNYSRFSKQLRGTPMSPFLFNYFPSVRNFDTSDTPFIQLVLVRIEF